MVSAMNLPRCEHPYSTKLLGVGPVHVRELLHGRPPALVFQGCRGVGADAGDAGGRIFHDFGGGDLALLAFGHPRAGHWVWAPPLLLGRLRDGHGGHTRLLRAGAHRHRHSLLRVTVLFRRGGPAHDVGACCHLSGGSIPAPKSCPPTSTTVISPSHTHT